MKAERPRRQFVQPEQVPALLQASNSYLGRRGRPLLATLAGAGLRIQEALDLERRHVNLARGTLTVQKSKTYAGVRVVDLTPALRDELAVSRSRSRPTSSSRRVPVRDSRQNVRKRLLVKAVEKANVELDRLGIEPIGSVPRHPRVLPNRLRNWHERRFCGAAVARGAALVNEESRRLQRDS